MGRFEIIDESVRSKKEKIKPLNHEHFLVNILGIILLKVCFIEVNAMCFTCSWTFGSKPREERVE